jgi:hypothetical protein
MLLFEKKKGGDVLKKTMGFLLIITMIRMFFSPGDRSVLAKANASSIAVH